MKIGIVMLMFLPLLVFSQEKNTWKAGFHSIVAGGTVTGETATKLFVQYSGGVSYSRYFTGIGIGYDAYRFNTIPVFADWRVNFGRRKVLFVYTQAGINIPANYKQPDIRYEKDHMRSDFYTDLGTGYRFYLGRSQHLSLSAGYSHKKIVQTQQYAYPCGMFPCYQSANFYTYHYSFGRIALKAGWEFGK